MTFWTRKDKSIRRDESIPETEMKKIRQSDYEMLPVKEGQVIKSEGLRDRPRIT